MNGRLSYSRLQRFRTFEDRFEYLALHGTVGEATFGWERYLNQDFYRSREWKMVRNHIIARDNGCDLGVPGYEIYDRIHIHHLNPMTPDGLVDFDPSNLDPENLITTSHRTHNAIHYGDASLLPKQWVPRSPGDTTLWGPVQRGGRYG